jgi:hypothetical protein
MFPSYVGFAFDQLLPLNLLNRTIQQIQKYCRLFMPLYKLAYDNHVSGTTNDDVLNTAMDTYRDQYSSPFKFTGYLAAGSPSYTNWIRMYQSALILAGTYQIPQCTKVVDCQLMRVRESNSMGNALCSPTLQNSHCIELCCQNNRWSITRP